MTRIPLPRWLLFFAICQSTGFNTSLAKTLELHPKSATGAAQKTISFELRDLLSAPGITEVTIPADPVYGGRSFKVKAVPLSVLFRQLGSSKGDQISFKCEDGFTTSIAVEELISEDQNKAISYLAIEEQEKPWSNVLVNGLPTDDKAGPTRLIWTRPELSKIKAEQWPYAVTSISVTQDLSVRYPSLFIPAGSENKTLIRGSASFIKNCFVCHTVNHLGEATKGPDLNVPYNPTEYLQPFALKLLIRDPQSLRSWRNAQMHPFPKNEVSDQEVDEIVSYLAYLAKNKVTSKK